MKKFTLFMVLAVISALVVPLYVSKYPNTIETVIMVSIWWATIIYGTSYFGAVWTRQIFAKNWGGRTRK